MKELGAAEIESENFVRQVETIHDVGKAVTQLDAALSVYLKVRIEIVVAQRSFEPAGSAILENLSIDVGLVVGEANANRKTAAIVRWTDIP